MNARILLVEDNLDILEINRELLQAEGYEISTATTLTGAWQQLSQFEPHLVMLDVMLPDGSGVDFCKQVRSQSKVPILFLTCMDEHRQVVDGLRAGGDDYMVKPYDLDEMVARVGALLRRSGYAKPVAGAEFGPLKIDYTTQRAFIDGVDLLATPREFALLAVLVRAEGGPITKENLYTASWGQAPSEDMRTLRVHISTLRKKMQPKLGIIFVPALGYRLVKM